MPWKPAGAPITEGYVRNGRFSYADGLTEGAALLALGQPPTAIFAANDETALGVLEAARAPAGCAYPMT